MGSFWIPHWTLKLAPLQWFWQQFPALGKGSVDWSPGRAAHARPLAGAFVKDTLAWGILHIIPRSRGCVHFLCIGELAHQLHLEIFSSLILLPSVDEHFVLQRKDICQRSQGPGLEETVQAKLGGWSGAQVCGDSLEISPLSVSPPGRGSNLSSHTSSWAHHFFF